MAGTLFEAAWEDLFRKYDPFWVISIGTFIIHEASYFGSYLPFYLIDYFPYFHKWKIQQDKVNDGPQQIRCLKRLLFSHFFIQLPMILLTHPTLDYLGMTHSVPLPDWKTVAWQIAAFFVVEDFYFYWIHRLLHYGAWYKYIHKIHHEHAAPFGMAAEYAHPIETMFLGIGTILGPVLFARHVFVLWVWLIVRCYQTVECHTGYDFPWSIGRFVPFWGGADFHDYHHMAFMGNYASTFRWCDRLFGTDGKYISWKAKGTEPTSTPKVSSMPSEGTPVSLKEE